MAMVTTAAADWLSKARRLIEGTARIFFPPLHCPKAGRTGASRNTSFFLKTDATLPAYDIALRTAVNWLTSGRAHPRMAIKVRGAYALAAAAARG
jgi:hypothetical protein